MFLASIEFATNKFNIFSIVGLDLGFDSQHLFNNSLVQSPIYFGTTILKSNICDIFKCYVMFS